MTQADTDLNLMFGLVALQNDLIDRDALVVAFQAWTRNKGRALAEYLVEHGDLEAGDRDAIEALVARYLRKHGGDPEKSLASIPAARSIREQLGVIGVPELDGIPGRVAAPVSTAGIEDGERTATYGFGVATAKAARFLLLRPHAKGGIGQVGVALDTELNREVALKEIQAQLADDPSSRHRFLLEAEVTGRLEHPGVVPVYGLGARRGPTLLRHATDPWGQPQAGDRAVHGGRHAAGSQPFGACAGPARAAVPVRGGVQRRAYAHSRGVIHRDLKPSNVMLGPYGETLVVDWGWRRSSAATIRPRRRS